MPRAQQGLFRCRIVNELCSKDLQGLWPQNKGERELILTHDPETWPRSIVDYRGSSSSAHRTFCKQCGAFIDEVPGDFYKERRNAANQVQQRL